MDTVEETEEVCKFKGLEQQVDNNLELFVRSCIGEVAFAPCGVESKHITLFLNEILQTYPLVPSSKSEASGVQFLLAFDQTYHHYPYSMSPHIT